MTWTCPRRRQKASEKWDENEKFESALRSSCVGFKSLINRFDKFSWGEMFNSVRKKRLKYSFNDNKFTVLFFILRNGKIENYQQLMVFASNEERWWWWWWCYVGVRSRMTSMNKHMNTKIIFSLHKKLKKIYPQKKVFAVLTSLLYMYLYIFFQCFPFFIFHVIFGFSSTFPSSFNLSICYFFAALYDYSEFWGLGLFRKFKMYLFIDNNYNMYVCICVFSFQYSLNNNRRVHFTL